MERGMGVSGRMASRLFFIACLMAWSLPQPGRAADGTLWGRDTLLGDGAARAALAQDGIALAGNSIDETLSGVSGGTRQASFYDGRMNLELTVDLGKAFALPETTLYANTYWTHGESLSARALNSNLMTVSNVEAVPSLRLFDLWIEHSFTPCLSLRIGQLAADDEFLASETAANFDNATFGWPAILGTDLPSGGPIYDLATPGARIQYTPSPRWTFRAALFNGNPASPCGAAPQVCNPDGLAFRLDGGAFTMAEADYRAGPDEHAPIYKLGGWWHSGTFADQAFGAPHRQDFGFYAVADAPLWHRPAGTHLSGFLRLAYAPPDRNPVTLYGDGGLALTGLPGRPDDVLGLAFAFAQMSGNLRNRARLTVPAVPLPDHEAAIELTYHVKAAGWWVLQPDLQYVIHPGGSSAVADAVVFALRSRIAL